MSKINPVDSKMERAMSKGAQSLDSFTDGILPPLGAPSVPKPKLRPFIVSPFDSRYRAWQTFLVVLVFYTAWVSPFEFGFLMGPKGPLDITDNIVNAFFVIDIVLSFFVAYLDKSTYLLVDEPKQIAFRYARTGLVFDVISSIPYELIRKIMPQKSHSYGFFTMLRLWRIRRVSAMFERMEKDTNFNYILVRTTKLVCGTLFSIHLAACCFYLIAYKHKDPTKTWLNPSADDFHELPLFDNYVTSVYWSIVTVSSVGYGDYHPVNTAEMIFDIFYLLYILGLTCYIIGNFTNLIVEATNRTRKYRETIDAASSFGKRNHLPRHLKDQMIAHLSLKHRIDSEGVQQQETVESLPKAIRTSISHFLFYSLVDKVYLFQGVSNDLLFQLVSEMKAEYFPHGEDIILQNEAPTEMYILVNGAVDLISHRNAMERVVGELKTGDACGEVGVLCYRPQVFTVRTKRLSQLLRLNRTEFMNILQTNVGDATIIMNNLLEHLKHHTDPVMQETLAYTEQMLAHGRFDMPLSLCFAADRGDDLMLNQLLRRGSDPNELDSNGRSALHLAAAKGFLECVVQLLDHGANPNRKDSEGNVPLWDAILGKNESVIKVLSDNGATLSSGDVGQFAYFAAEQNEASLLHDIIKFRGDVTLANSYGTTALHKAVANENVEICRILIENGADPDKSDLDGWTPRGLADHQGHEEIKILLETRGKLKATQRQGGSSASPQPPAHRRSGSMEMSPDSEGIRARPKRRQSSMRSSLAGIITASQRQSELGGLSSPASYIADVAQSCPRVTLSCPEKGDTAGKLVPLPGSILELLDLGYQKFGFHGTKIMTKDGYLVEDLSVVRDGDHLILAIEGAADFSF